MAMIHNTKSIHCALQLVFIKTNGSELWPRKVELMCAFIKHNYYEDISRLMVYVVSHEAKKKQHACTSSGLCNHYSE